MKIKDLFQVVLQLGPVVPAPGRPSRPATFSPRRSASSPADGVVGRERAGAGREASPVATAYVDTRNPWANPGAHATRAHSNSYTRRYTETEAHKDQLPPIRTRCS